MDLDGLDTSRILEAIRVVRDLVERWSSSRRKRMVLTSNNREAVFRPASDRRSMDMAIDWDALAQLQKEQVVEHQPGAHAITATRIEMNASLRRVVRALS